MSASLASARELLRQSRKEILDEANYCNLMRIKAQASEAYFAGREREAWQKLAELDEALNKLGGK